MSADTYDDVEELVDAILDRLGTDIVVGTPLGIGKPNNVLNELVRRALENSDIELEIWTALSLSKPDGSSELERRVVEPLGERLFGEYPNMEYDIRLQNGTLPENIEVHEFYFQPGKHMGNPEAQQHYHSVNYTHAVRAFRNAEPNLLLQLVGKRAYENELHYNIGTNTDLTSELLDSLIETRESGERDVMIVGEVNQNMPFLYGQAPVPAEKFDAVLDDESYDFPLFGPPKEPVSLVDHAIALRVSTLVRDGGTLQIGIGSLGDAIGHALSVRHNDNETYREVVDALRVRNDAPDLVENWGGLDTFEDGLYGSTEMFVEAFLHLYQDGVLTREVYDDVHIQQLVNDGVVDTDEGETIDESVLEFLLDEGAIDERLDAEDVAYLQEWGILTEDAHYEDGELTIAGEAVPADLTETETRERLVEYGLGDELTGGRVLHGAFFLGSNDFYEGLRELSEEERRKISMQSVFFTNALYGDESLKRLQRQDARFVNTGMKATLTGGVVSDGTEDGHVVSGVGGQFNFVNQAQELDDGRSILMIRSTRESDGEVESNIVWNYGHLTIPRHLRDIVVTEYGVADLRDRADADVIAELICIADSRFQDDLVEEAKAAGKLPADWEVPEQYRKNYPELLEQRLGPFRERDVLPRFPYGTRLTDEELALVESLRNLESTIEARELSVLLDPGALKNALTVPEESHPYLERMDLDTPSGLRERALQRAVVFALVTNDVC